MYKFNNTNILTGYIKQLLHSFNLPGCKIITDGTYVTSGETYLLQSGKLVKSTFTGFVLDASSFTDFIILQPYIYGKKYLNITHNCPIKNNIYDTLTHEYLGEYLRFIRDYNNLDLMSLYNCFGNDVAKNININITRIVNSSEVICSFKSTDPQYKIYKVPVKFNKKYTIGIDCDSSIDITTAMYSNGKVIKLKLSGEYSLENKSYLHKTSTKFRSPFIYDKLVGILDGGNTNNSLLMQHEKDLCLFIKVPYQCKSAITILEGDYTSCCELSLPYSKASKFEFDTNYFVRYKDYSSLSPSASYIANSNEDFVKVLDCTIPYYLDSARTTQVKIVDMVLGNTYYYLGASSTSESITLSSNVTYYNLSKHYQMVNIVPSNTLYTILFVDSFPSSGKVNTLYVLKSDNKLYRYNGSTFETLGENNDLDKYEKLDRKFNTKLQLLLLNVKVSFPFADKLVAYLLDNVVVPTDSIVENIETVQRVLAKRRLSGKSGLPSIKELGIWDPSIRNVIYEISTEMSDQSLVAKYTDLLGYYDKEVEKYLGWDWSSFKGE